MLPYIPSAPYVSATVSKLMGKAGRQFPLFVGTILLALPLFLRAQTEVPSAYRTVENITYAQGVNGSLQADAYIPDGAGPFPGIVFIHGGAWTGGNRNQMIKLIRDLATRGYVGFTIEYDVDPVHFPASLQESLKALGYFREHSKEYNLDPKRVAVAGSSAGGELAALVALTPKSKVQAAVILNGVLDLAALGDDSKMVTDYLGGPCTQLLRSCKAASPVDQVHAGAPPFFVGHGTADETVPYSQAEAFVGSLKAAKVRVKFFTARDAPHTYWIREAFYEVNRDEIVRFLHVALR